MCEFIMGYPREHIKSFLKFISMYLRMYYYYIIVLVGIIWGSQCCPLDQFTCNNGECISKGWQCDGECDCSDGEDETNCQVTFAATTHFRAMIVPTIAGHDIDYNDITTQEDNEISVPYELVTSSGDGDVDTTQDHGHCDQQVWFQCWDGKCINKYWHCDGEKDCSKGEDEINCHITTGPDVVREIPSNGNSDVDPTDHHSRCDQLRQFQCWDGSCINYSWHCDGETDCPEGEDEDNCLITTEPNLHALFYTDVNKDPIDCNQSTQFSCINGQCIEYSWRCDGENDCSEGEDEINCSVTTEPDSVGGLSGMESLEASKVRVSEDLDCKGFRCHNQICVSRTQRCNGVDDCGDNSDENRCHETTVTFCDDLFCNNRGICFRNDSNKDYCKCNALYEGDRCEIVRLSLQYLIANWIIVIQAFIFIVVTTVFITFCCIINRRIRRLKRSLAKYQQHNSNGNYTELTKV